MARVRVAAVVIVAVIVGTAMARGLPHHAAAPAPAASSSGGGGLGYDVLALAVVAGAIGLAIGLWHRRKMRELHMAEARLDRFVNVRRSDLSDLWRCPDCHGLILLADIDDHQEDSPCARDRARQEAENPAEPAEWVAAQVPGMAATVPPEHSVSTGDVDTFRELSE